MNRDDSLIHVAPASIGHDEIRAWLVPHSTSEAIKVVTAHMLFVVLTADPAPWPDLASFLQYAKQAHRDEFCTSLTKAVFLYPLNKLEPGDKKKLFGLIGTFQETSKLLC